MHRFCLRNSPIRQIPYNFAVTLQSLKHFLQDFVSCLILACHYFSAEQHRGFVLETKYCNTAVSAHSTCFHVGVSPLIIIS